MVAFEIGLEGSHCIVEVAFVQTYPGLKVLVWRVVAAAVLRYMVVDRACRTMRLKVVAVELTWSDSFVLV